MRVVQLANFVSPTSGGIARTLHHLRAGYRDNGVDTTLIVPGAVDSTMTDGSNTTITVRSPTVPRTGGYRLITDLAKVRRLLESAVPDRVEVHDRFSLRYVGDWARRADIPSTLVVHERLDRLAAQHLPWLVRPGLLARRDNERTAARFDDVVVPSAWAAQEFRGCRAPHVVGWGVDHEQFHPRRRSAVVRRQLLAGHDVLVAMVVRLSPEKQAGSAIEGLRVLRSQGVDARMVVAGTGASERHLRRAATGLPISFLGHLTSRQHVAEVLAAADVALCPGPMETFGLTALEALACGTPVVSSRSGAVAELLRAPFGEGAYNHGRAMAGAIGRVLAYGDAARPSARAVALDHDWTSSVSKMLAVHGMGSAIRRASDTTRG